MSKWGKSHIQNVNVFVSDKVPPSISIQEDGTAVLNFHNVHYFFENMGELAGFADQLNNIVMDMVFDAPTSPEESFHRYGI